MKKLLILFTIFLGCAHGVWAQNMSEDNDMKIKLILDNNKEVVVQMVDNTAVRQFLNMLPNDFEFIDFAREEKISEFPKSLSLIDAPRGMVATAGKMFIYAPWGNFGFFYRNHGNVLDKSLIELGSVESGLEHLSAYKGGFHARIEIVNNL